MRTGGRTDGRKDRRDGTVAFRNCANAPEKRDERGGVLCSVVPPVFPSVVLNYDVKQRKRNPCYSIESVNEPTDAVTRRNG